MIEFIKFIRIKHSIIAILFLMIIYSIYKGSCLILGLQNAYEGVMNVPLTIIKISLSICIVIFLAKAKWVNVDVLSFRNTGKALIQGGFILSIVIILFVQTLINKKPDIAGIKIIQYILGLISVGIFEEFFFRLGVLHILLKKWHTTSLDINFVCFFTGFLFGLIHIGNLSHKGISLSYVITQMIFAAGYGSFAAAVYICSKNIWGLVIIHAMNDASIYAHKMDGMKTNTTNGGTSFLITELLFLLFWSIITRFILRKKIMNKILENNK
jgi:membrane protease YdiL (CAAX protease family)